MKIDVRKIIFGIIIVVCIIAVNFAVYWQFFKKDVEEKPSSNIISNEQLAANFNEIFTNTLNKQGATLGQIGKIKETEDIIFTSLSKKENIENKYEVNVNIPYVNIENDLVKAFNERVNNIFTRKYEEIVANANDGTIYNVEYVAYINTNILSLVIKSTLKEGENPQRVIVQTYNYNLSTNEEISLEEIIHIKELPRADVEEQIKQAIIKANKQATSLKELGYNVYSRDVENSMYKIGNTRSYFIGENGALYILYPYGNSNYTSEIDIVVF